MRVDVCLCLSVCVFSFKVPALAANSTSSGGGGGSGAALVDFLSDECRVLPGDPRAFGSSRPPLTDRPYLVDSCLATRERAL